MILLTYFRNRSRMKRFLGVQMFMRIHFEGFQLTIKLQNPYINKLQSQIQSLFTNEFQKKMFPFMSFTNFTSPYNSNMYGEIQKNQGQMQFYPYHPFYYFSSPSLNLSSLQQVSHSTPTLEENSSVQGFKPFQNVSAPKISAQSKNSENFSEHFSQFQERNKKCSPFTIKSKRIQKNDKKLINPQRNNSTKQKKTKIENSYAEEEYSDEQERSKKKTQEQEHLYLKYRRKNTQSNIINRIYSFLKSQFKGKAEGTFPKLTEQMRSTYLKYLSCVEQCWKGPIKRQLLLNLLNIDQQLPGYKQIKRIYQKQGLFSLKEFEKYNRIVIHSYLTMMAPISVITSKKMKKAVWKEHLQKIRELKIYFLTGKYENN